MTIKRIVSLLVLAGGVFVISCSKDKQPGGNAGNTPPVNCNEINAGFAADILPLVQTRCATGIGCHGSGSSNGPGALTNFSQVKNASAAIRFAVTSRQMPLGSSLSSTQIDQISCWVDNGSLNN